ncbi:TRAP transporter small permease [Sporanaerobium hydrogeniformans]|uniref:TRAP transporter small permease n=1 Tax=Sporanaerobium hydrogeniformans TaxID=3072179 RepID=UPI0015D4D044|nr:TRAP transporter small permease subunit [Sporanaerobium hydrogeniformans]
MSKKENKNAMPPKGWDAVTKFFDAVHWLFMSFCKCCFILMVALTSYVVFNRYIIKNPLTWGEPVVLMCMVYMSLISAALAIRKDTHIRMTVIDFVVPRRVSDVLKGCAHIGITFFSWFMIIYGFEFCKIAAKSTMTGVGIKNIWLYLSVPIAGVALALMESERLLNFIKRRLYPEWAKAQNAALEGLSVQEQKIVEALEGEGI